MKRFSRDHGAGGGGRGAVAQPPPHNFPLMLEWQLTTVARLAAMLSSYIICIIIYILRMMTTQQRELTITGATFSN